EARDRQDAGHDAGMYARRGAAVAESQETVRVEEELRDRALRAGVELRPEVVELEIGARRLGMHFRIGRDGNLEVRDRSQALHQIDRIRVALGCGTYCVVPCGGSPRKATMWRMPCAQ